MPPVCSVLVCLIRDERGQDMVEYALLAGAVGLAAAASFQLILAAIGGIYGHLIGGANDLWVPPNPGAGS
jgi:Flp pilus assembly pilin Flp